MHPIRRFRFVLLLAASLVPTWAVAQDNGWSLDPGILASGQDLLRHTPPRQMDGLFQAVHAAAGDDDHAQVLCDLFEPDADRSLSGLNVAAERLGAETQQRFASAVANALVASLQAPAQPDDSAVAQQGLKSAAVTAAMLHDGFAAGFQADGDSRDSRTMRCQSLRWLLDAMQTRPLAERAAMTRMLLQQGMSQSRTSAGD